MARNARLDVVCKAICAGHRGQIEWKASCLERFRNDAKMKSFTEVGVKLLVWEFVCQQNGSVQYREETAQEWLEENPDAPCGRSRTRVP